MAGATARGCSGPPPPSRMPSLSSRAQHQKGIGPNWIEVTSEADFRRFVGSTGVAVVETFRAQGFKAYYVQHGGGLDRTVENWIIRDNVDRVISYGPEVLEVMIAFIHRELRAFSMDYHMLHAFLPKVDDLLHGGGVQFVKEDFCHLKCVNEAFRFARNNPRSVTEVSEYLVTLLATGPLSPKQMTQFVHCLYANGFPSEAFDKMAVPTEFDMSRLGHVYRVDNNVPDFTNAVRVHRTTLAHYLTAFGATLLVNQDCGRAVKMFIRAGVPGVAAVVHAHTKDDHPWSLTLTQTERYLLKKIDHAVRSAKNRLFYKHRVGTLHPRKDAVVETYTIPCPYDCLVGEEPFQSALRIAPGKFMESHVKVTHRNKEVIPCPECGLTLPSESGGLGPVTIEGSYINHAVYCDKNAPPYTTDFRWHNPSRGFVGPSCLNKLIAYPRIGKAEEFPDVMIDYFLIGSSPEHVVFGVTLPERTLSVSEMEMYVNVLKGDWNPRPWYRACTDKYIEDKRARD